MFKFWQPEQNGPITLSLRNSKIKSGGKFAYNQSPHCGLKTEKWSLPRERRWKEMQKKEKQIWTKSSSWILPAANCWFYFLSQLQVHSCLWVLWNPSIIVIPSFSLFSCQIKFLLKEAQITQKRIWTMGSFIPKTTNPAHKPYSCSECPLALPMDGSPSLICSLRLRSMLAVNLQCPHSLTRVFSVLLPRSFLLFWNINVKLLCMLSWSERAHCQKMFRIWYSVTPSDEFLTLIPLCCS